MSPELSIAGMQAVQGIKIPTAEALTRPLRAVIPDATRVEWAKTISDWTMRAADERLMLPKSPDEILDLFRKKHAVVMVDKDGNPLSHVAATFIYSDGRIEVGALCTDVANRRKGYGRGTVLALLSHLNQLYPGNNFFALANKDSENLFRKLGGTEMDASELHKDVWSACKNCKRKPPVNANGEFRCCDKPFDLTNAAQNKPTTETVVFNPQSHTNGKNGANHVNI